MSFSYYAGAARSVSRMQSILARARCRPTALNFTLNTISNDFCFHYQHSEEISKILVTADLNVIKVNWKSN